MDFKDLDEIRSFVTDLELEIEQLRKSVGMPEEASEDNRNTKMSDAPSAEPVYADVSDKKTSVDAENLFDLDDFKGSFEGSKSFSVFSSDLPKGNLKSDIGDSVGVGVSKENSKDVLNSEPSDIPVAEPVYADVSDKKTEIDDEGLFDFDAFKRSFDGSKDFSVFFSDFPKDSLKSDVGDIAPEESITTDNYDVFDSGDKNEGYKLSSKDYVDTLDLNFTPSKDFEFTATLPISKSEVLPENKDDPYEDEIDRLFYGFKSVRKGETYEESLLFKESEDPDTGKLITEENDIVSETENVAMKEVSPEKSDQISSDIDEIVRILEGVPPAGIYERKAESFNDGFFIESEDKFNTDIPKTGIDEEKEINHHTVDTGEEENFMPIEQSVSEPMFETYADDISIDVLGKKLDIGIIIGELRPRYSELNLSDSGNDPIMKFDKVTTKYQVENESGDSELLFEGLSLDIKKDSITAVISDEPIRSKIFLGSVKDEANLRSGKVIFADDKKGRDIVYFDSDNILIPDISVLHFLLLCLDRSKDKISVRREKLNELLVSMGLPDISDTEIKYLTRFQKDMVLLISAAIVNLVRGVVVNIYFGELAESEKKIFYDVFSLLSKNGKTVLVPSTGNDEILNIANRAVVLEADKVSFEGTIVEFMDAKCPSTFVIRNASEDLMSVVFESFKDVSIKKTERGLKVSYFGDEIGLSNLLMLILENGIDHTEIVTTRRTFDDIRLKGGEGV